MSRRQLKSDDEEGFIRAYRDEIFDLEDYYEVRVQASIRIKRGGPGLVLWFEAERKDAEGQWQTYAQAEYAYPSHGSARLHAALYAAAIRISVEVSRRYEKETGMLHPAAADSTRKG